MPLYSHLCWCAVKQSYITFDTPSGCPIALLHAAPVCVMVHIELGVVHEIDQMILVSMTVHTIEEWMRPGWHIHLYTGATRLLLHSMHGCGVGKMDDSPNDRSAQHQLMHDDGYGSSQRDPTCLTVYPLSGSRWCCFMTAVTSRVWWHASATYILWNGVMLNGERPGRRMQTAASVKASW